MLVGEPSGAGSGGGGRRDEPSPDRRAVRGERRERGALAAAEAAHGHGAAGSPGGDKRSHRIEAHASLILAQWEARRDITLEELRAALAQQGVAVAGSTLWRFFRRYGMTRKKDRHAAEKDRPDILSRREAWFDAQPDLDPERLAFIDETRASTKMARPRSRCLRRERVRMSVPHGRWTNTTFVGALRLTE